MNNIIVHRARLVRRINRQIEPWGKALRKSRSSRKLVLLPSGRRAWLYLGEYYLLDQNKNLIYETDVNVARLASSLGLCSMDDWPVQQDCVSDAETEAIAHQLWGPA
ncbi:MAG: hypothetical protein ABSC64_11950 [Candidatus Korobacteraceae bacterium]|jgi:hypothetical protein